MYKKIFLGIFLACGLYAEGAAPVECPEPDLFRKDVCVFSAHGEFLYWTVAEGALEYALEKNHPAWGPVYDYGNGNYKLAKYNWDPGFRVALSYFRAPKYWEAKGEYARVVVDGSDSANKPAEADLYLNATFPGLITELSSAKSKIRMDYNLADFIAARVFIPNPHLRLRFLGGFTFADIKQNWRIAYFGGDYRTDIKNKWKFMGPGFRLGTSIDWFWGQNIYLTAKSTFGLLIGKYRNSSWGKTNNDTLALHDPNIPFRDVKYKHWRPAFHAQFLLGPSWQKNFSCMRAELFAGYELNGWFNLQDIYHYSYDAAPGTKQSFLNEEMFAIHGLTTRLTLDF